MKTMSRGGYLTGKVPTARHDIPDQPSPELRLGGTIRLNRGQTGSAWPHEEPLPTFFKPAEGPLAEGVIVPG
ncbi:hypothetical protein [Methylobacterium radiotolerans]|uniref:hypothetical protein n=1 Tax=Methylobacterium radiotolerans TaxID=31998 RepID=UPI001F425DF1|nr:hypothetical protein [Methylobacterium radiotolerans]UIY43409.1 hypothetical protein LZ599_06760 [Methylobacterium radiotolerans]